MAGYIGSLPVVNWFDSYTGLKGTIVHTLPILLLKLL